MFKTKRGIGTDFEKFMHDRHHKNVITKVENQKRDILMLKYMNIDGSTLKKNKNNEHKNYSNQNASQQL